MTAPSFTQPERLLAELRRQTFDLLILDWNMPELSGIETLRRVAEGAEPRPPVLLLTSRSVEADLVEGLNAGADDYIVKPLQPPVLLARVNALARRAYRPAAAPQVGAVLALTAWTPAPRPWPGATASRP